MNEPIADRAGALIAGRYELLALLGRGGMADVYRARDRVLEREVAVKTLNEPSEAIRYRFLLEARSLAQLNHPAITAIYDTGTDGDVSYIVMELVEGRNLRDVRDAGTSIGAVVRILIRVLDALAYAHDHGVVHRDVKPANIQIGPSGVKLMDFGLSRRISDLSAGTQAGEIVGTVAYLPPERFLGKPSDARGDLYSIGIVLYELITGVQPFRSDVDDLVAVIFAHLNDRPQPPGRIGADVHPELERIALKLLEKNPNDRYATAAALQADLSSFLVAYPDAATVRLGAGGSDGR